MEIREGDVKDVELLCRIGIVIGGDRDLELEFISPLAVTIFALVAVARPVVVMDQTLLLQPTPPLLLRSYAVSEHAASPPLLLLLEPANTTVLPLVKEAAADVFWGRLERDMACLP